MPKPLRSDDPNPQPVQFRDFGVLNDGTRSKGAAVTSITVNVVIALMLVFLVKATVLTPKKPTATNIAYVEPVTPPPPPPPPPKLPPVPKLRTPPPPPKEIPLPPEPTPKPLPTPPVPKPEPVKTTPTPPAPKAVTPPPAPKPVAINVSAASVPNHDAHPSPVRLGNMTNPLQPLKGPAVSPINMGVAGAPGMNASNNGNGPRSVAINAGSGSPNGSMNGHDRGVQPVSGLSNGVPGGTGRSGTQNLPVGPPQIATSARPAPSATPSVQALSAASPPTVVYQPKPVYTSEALTKHIEGNITVRIHVASNGQVQVLQVVHGLGFGLDQAAMNAAQGIRFKPAKDANGNAVDWTGNVVVQFLMA